MGPDDLDALAAGAAEVVPADGLRDKLALGRPLRVKLGLDPTAPDVTLGWAVVLRKLRQFQDAGHVAVLIVGDFTARVGDPSGKTETRPQLAKDVVQAFADRLLDQFWRILDRERTEVRYNAEWLEVMDMEDVLRLTASTTVARMLERDDFATRFAEQRPISLLEFMYPLLQGMDSVAVQADVELGGTDQTFNLMMGRDIQRAFGKPEQAVLTLPLLVGTDGREKMSKSLGNYVGVTDPPEEMYGKTMRISDEQIGDWFSLLLLRDPPADLPPNDAKRALARGIVERYHGAEAAEAAEAHFVRQSRRKPPEDVAEASFTDDPVHLPAVLGDAFGVSRSEVRRMIGQGGVRIEDEPVSSEDVPAEQVDGRVVRMGKRRYVRLRRAA
jgi:tyrosyl-tRNA synthetase